MPNKYVAQRIKLFDAQLETPFTRADIQLLGLRHAGASYEASIFINNPNADLSTEHRQNKENGIRPGREH